MNLLTILPKLERREIGYIGFTYEVFILRVKNYKSVGYWEDNPMQVGLLDAQKALKGLVRYNMHGAWNQDVVLDLIAKLHTLINQAHLELDKTGEP